MKKILIVEDSIDLANNVKYMLSKSGYTVLVANDGAEGVTIAKEKLPDLIIMDLMLPGMQGGDAVSAIKKFPACRDIPVIFMTGLMSSKEQGEEIETIIVDGKNYPALPKPFDFPKLIKTIESIL